MADNEGMVAVELGLRGIRDDVEDEGDAEKDETDERLYGLDKEGTSGTVEAIPVVRFNDDEDLYML